MNQKVSKKIIILLPLAFLSGIILLYVLARSNIRPVSISLPLAKATPTPAEQAIFPTPTVVEEVVAIGDELNLIEKDLNVAKKEDRRLIPPDFIFQLGF